MNRAPSPQRWEQGDIMSIDFGGNYHGYIGDVCRMAIQGEPDGEIAGSARRDREHPARGDEADARRRHGQGDLRRGRAAGRALAAITTTSNSSRTAWAWSATKAPRLHRSRTGAVSGRTMRNWPLEAGMVVSVETTLMHPSARLHQIGRHGRSSPTTGHEVYGEGARGWNRAGMGLKSLYPSSACQWPELVPATHA